jgi:hypothetical protein
LLWSLWLVLHLAFLKTFIFHDSWQHIFPITFKLWNSIEGWRLPTWVGGVDSGSPTILYITAISLLQVVRLSELYVGSWLDPSVEQALYLHKAEILVSYSSFCFGAYVLGRVLYRNRSAALYLAVACLYAGLGLDALHSDQIISILFWLPWVILCGALAHRLRRTAQAATYLNIALLLLAVAALDQYPHFVALVAAVGMTVYVLLYPRDVSAWFSRWWWRLWPGALALVLLATQLGIVRQAIDDYRPGLRAEAIVDPSTMGVTGFVQPSAFLGLFTPLTFMSLFEVLDGTITAQLGRSIFIYKLDSLVFGVGFISIVLGVAFLIQGHVRTRIGWFGSAAVILLVSMQDSKLYFLLFHVPFFDLFRSYFLYIVVVVLLFIIISGYGLDTCLALEEGPRRRLLLKSVALVAVCVCASLAVQLWILDAPAALARIAADWPYALGDLAALTISLYGVWRFAQARPGARQGVYGLLGAVAASQALYLAGAYVNMGIDVDQVISRLGVEGHATPTTSQPAREPHIAANFERRECAIFAECYLTPGDTASLRQDLNGTLWRSKPAALFQPDLDPRVVSALSGVTHPVFWFSDRAVPVQDTSEVVQALNSQAGQIQPALAQLVYVAAKDAGSLNQEPTGRAAGATVTQLERGSDWLRLWYRADNSALLNAAMTFDPAWSARLDGQPTQLFRGNFDGLVLSLPAGEHQLELSYVSVPQQALIACRFAQLLVALIAVVHITRLGLQRLE